MIYLSCGIIIGIVMGLTGAGGALVAIPLFIQFLGMGLKEASVYSLVAVIMASLLNFIAQRKATRYRTGLLIVTASALGSFVSAPYKENLSSFYVAIILSAVSLYALYSIWVTNKTKTKGDSIPNENLILSVTVGLSLGILTTFTGLGGGVLMLPVFLALFHFSHSQSVATSLFAVGLSSLASLLIQVSHGTKFEVNNKLGFLMIGIILSVLILKGFTAHFPQRLVILTRQIIFTLVVTLALLKIF